ncbi:hypothetical protein F5X96DRAFT_661071 [Biscogniauxia mediterranea]|nr:hypothetical protein F5X96DRAFT_661071 [Biscogniauxia mediterranea]
MYARTALALLLSLAGGSGLVSAAAADPEPAPAKAVRDVITPRETTSPNLLSALFRLANQFDVAACVPAALPLITTLPKIPPALLGTAAINQALSQTTLALSDVCRFSVTGDVGDAFTAFLPTWYAWYREQSAAIASIVTACPSASALVSTVEAYGRCAQVTATEEEESLRMSIQTSGGDDTSAALSSSAFSIQTDTVIGGGGGDDTTSAGPTATATATATSSSSSAQSSTATTGAGEAPSQSSTVPTDGAPRETGFILAAAAAAGFVGLVAAL